MRIPFLAAAATLTVVAVSSPSAAATPNATIRTVTAVAETPPLFDDEAGGDADADDPAIWIDRSAPGRSIVIGTAKNAGLRVYDLAGREIQSIPAPAAPGPDNEPGRFNNVDVVSGLRVGGRGVDVAVVTDRGRDQLRFYRIVPGTRAGAAHLVDITVDAAPFLFSRDQAEVDEATTGYGLATFTAHGATYAVVSRRHTSRVGVFRLDVSGGRMGYHAVDALDLPASFHLPNGAQWRPCDEPGVGPQVEGMAVHARGTTLYAAQEDVGLWRIPLAGARLGTPQLIERVREYGVPATYDPETEECTLDWAADPGFGGSRVAADIEGLTVRDDGRRPAQLLVSSQGDSRFLRFELPSHRYLGTFAVVDGRHADGTQHSDGAALTSGPIGKLYPAGLLVVHDGEDTPAVPGEDGEVRPATNFKLIDWRSLAPRR